VPADTGSTPVAATGALPVTSAPTTSAPPAAAKSPVDAKSAVDAPGAPPRVDRAATPDGPPRLALGSGAQQVNIQLPASVPAIPLGVTVTAGPLPTALPDVAGPGPSAQ
jgi:hypothetical protein